LQFRVVIRAAARCGCRLPVALIGQAAGERAEVLLDVRFLDPGPAGRLVLRIGQKAGPGAVLRPDQLAGTLPVFQVASLRAAIGLPRW